MRQATLKLKNYAGSISIADNTYIKRRLLRVILIAFAFFCVSYLVIIAGVVFNIVERRNLESHARNLATEVGELELAYLSKSGEIDLSLSESLGFKEVKANFAVRKAIGEAKSMGNFGSLKFFNNEI